MSDGGWVARFRWTVAPELAVPELIPEPDIINTIPGAQWKSGPHPEPTIGVRVVELRPEDIIGTEPKP